MLHFFIVIVCTLVVMYLVLVARSMLKDEPEENKSVKDRFLDWFKKSPSRHFVDFFKSLSSGDIIMAVIAGLVTGFCFYLVLTYGLVARTVVLLVALAAMTLIVVWWIVEGSDFKEMLPFIGLLVMSLGLMATTTIGMVEKLEDGPLWLTSMLKILPWVAGVAALALIIYNYFSFHYETMDSDDGSRAIAHRIGAWVTLVIAVVIIVVMIGTTVYSVASSGSTTDSYADDGAQTESVDNSEAEEPTDEGETKEGPTDGSDDEPEFWSGIRFYNDDVQNDGNDENDRNFGPKPRDGKKVDYYVDDRRERYSNDPVHLAQKLVSYDKAFGTHYAKQVLFNKYDDKLAALDLANACAQVLCTDKELFDRAVDLVDARQAEAKTRLEKRKNLTDQFYMEPYNLLGRPELVIYQSDVESDWVLVDTFTLKNGKKVEIVDRISCGYQECNAAKKFGVGKVSKIPTKPPKKPEKPGKGGSDKPKPKPKDKPKKDQTKRSALPNDKKGPGKNTIDPKDYEHSSEDTGDSTTSTTPEQYHNDNKDKGDAGKNQNTGGGSTDPSTDTGGAKDNHGSNADKKTDTSGGTSAGKDSDGTVSEPS